MGHLKARPGCSYRSRPHRTVPKSGAPNAELVDLSPENWTDLNEKIQVDLAVWQPKGFGDRLLLVSRLDRRRERASAAACTSSTLHAAQIGIIHAVEPSCSTLCVRGAQPSQETCSYHQFVSSSGV
jgi:hypothetical protein